MKQLLLLLAVFAVGCGVVEPRADLKAEMQVAVADITQAIVSEDVELFKTYWAPELYESSGSTDPERDVRTVEFMSTQRGGIEAFYSDKAPVVMSVEIVGNEVRVIISVDGTEATKSPKPVYFRRDDNGKLWWLGIRARFADGRPEGEQPNQVRQALSGLYGLYDVVAWDVQNQPGSPQHRLLTSYGTNHPAVPQCGAPPDLCSGLPACVIANSSASLFYPELDMDNIGVGAASWIVQPSNQHNNNYSTAMIFTSAVSPTNVTCGNSASSTTTPWFSCCWINGWGWDLWYPSNYGPNWVPNCSLSFCAPN